MKLYWALSLLYQPYILIHYLTQLESKLFTSMVQWSSWMSTHCQDLSEDCQSDLHHCLVALVYSPVHRIVAGRCVCVFLHSLSTVCEANLLKGREISRRANTDSINHKSHTQCCLPLYKKMTPFNFSFMHVAISSVCFTTSTLTIKMNLQRLESFCRRIICFSVKKDIKVCAS